MRCASAASDYCSFAASDCADFAITSTRRGAPSGDASSRTASAGRSAAPWTAAVITESSVEIRLTKPRVAPSGGWAVEAACRIGWRKMGVRRSSQGTQIDVFDTSLRHPVLPVAAPFRRNQQRASGRGSRRPECRVAFIGTLLTARDLAPSAEPPARRAVPRECHTRRAPARRRDRPTTNRPRRYPRRGTRAGIRGRTRRGRGARQLCLEQSVSGWGRIPRRQTRGDRAPRMRDQATAEASHDARHGVPLIEELVTLRRGAGGRRGSVRGRVVGDERFLAFEFELRREEYAKS